MLTLIFEIITYRNLSQVWHYPYFQGIEDADLEEVDDDGQTMEEQAVVRSFKASCYMNLALCYSKLGEQDHCIRACDDALALDPRKVKALYRRAMARLDGKSCEPENERSALQDLSLALELEPTNEAVR